MENQKQARQISKIVSHVGVQLDGVVKNSVDTENMKALLFEEPNGVYIEHKTKKVKVPYSNIQAIYYK